MTAVAVEKENKVGEMLMASATSDEILAGKLLGLGAAGQVQIAVWFSMALFGALSLSALLELAGFDVPWRALGVAACMFPLAYLFIGSLMMGTGSLGQTHREAQQLGLLWMMFTILPFLFITSLLAEPQGLLARTFSLVPFTAPVTMVFRAFLDFDGIAWWELPLSLVLLTASTVLSILLAARLFRVGLLLSGARPSFRQLLRQAGFGAR